MQTNVSTISERFRKIIDSTGLSDSKFSLSLGTSSSRISNILRGRNKPDYEILSKVIEVYPHINGVWLLTGNGLMVEKNGPFVDNTTIANEPEVKYDAPKVTLEDIAGLVKRVEDLEKKVG